MSRDAVLKNRNLLSVICPNLSLRDLYAFDRVNPGNGLVARFGDRAIVAQINARLGKIFGDNLPEFKRILGDIGAVISGSFVVQCILEEEWRDSDVDIYIGIETVPYVGAGTLMSTTPLEEFLYKKYTYTRNMWPRQERYRSVLRDINWIRNYDVNGHQIQVIHVARGADSLYDFIVEQSDFDICKAVYGVGPGVGGLDGKDYVKVHALDQVVAKRTTFNYYTRLGDSVIRYHKYRARGFTFDLPDGILERVRQTCRQGRKIFDRRQGVSVEGTEPDVPVPDHDYEYDDDIDIVDVEPVETVAQSPDRLTLRCDPVDHIYFQNLFVWYYEGNDRRMRFDEENALIYLKMRIAVKECNRNCPMRILAGDRKHLHVDGSDLKQEPPASYGECRDLVLLFAPFGRRAWCSAIDRLPGL